MSTGTLRVEETSTNLLPCPGPLRCEVDAVSGAHYPKPMFPSEPRFRNHLFSFGEASLALHSNLMPCVIFGNGETVRVASEREAIEARIVFIKPGVPHTVSIGPNGAEILYLDGVQCPRGTPGFRALQEDCEGIPNALKARDLAALDSFRSALEPGTLAPDIEVLKVVERMYEAPMERLGQMQMAEELGLERTQALKHFKANTGQTFRKFKIWAASLATVHAILRGQKIGSAGVDSGFSDAAHVARTARAIFGVTPTRGIGALKNLKTL